MFVELIDKRKKHFSRLRVEGSKKKTREEPDEESVKRQKLEDDAEKAELKLCLEIVPYDDKAVNFEPLATKSLIVDWKTQILGEEIYYQIKRADGSYKMYKIFNEMLNHFDRQDLIDLYRLEDELWRNQQDYTLISWELYDSCGVHSLLMDTVYIHMLVERTYPLTQLTLERMLNGRLQIDHECEMAYEFIRFIKSQDKK
ncbi:hypothetical protein Tco_0844156 [Tanacetum coccineum]